MSQPRGLVINNVLNIRRGSSKWQGLSKVQSDPAFCAFDSVQFCLRAGARILIAYRAEGIYTITDAISRWAPPSDNNPTADYIHNVCVAVGKGPKDIVDLDTVEIALPMLKAMAMQETGYRAPDAIFMQALSMAGISDAKGASLLSSRQLVATVGSVAASGTAAAAGLQQGADQVSTALAPYAAHSHHVGQILAGLAMVGAGCAGAAVLFQIVHHRAVGV